MNKELQLIQHLYGEREEHFALRETLETSEALHDEYQALSEAKFYLDHRRRQRPDAAILDQIMAAAAHVSEPAPQSSLVRGRLDRLARPHRAHRKRRTLSLVSLSLVMVCAMSIGLWQWTSSSAPIPQTASAETYQSALPPSATDGLASTMPQQASDETLPSWEDDQVMELHKRIDRLQQRATALQWDEPATPLEMVPALTNRSPATARLQQATQRRR